MLAPTERVLQHLRENAPDFGLRPESLRVEHLYNPGGNVNANFHATDGEHACHVKLAPDADGHAQPQRWRIVQDILEARYRAPRLLGWIELSPWSGPVFEHVPGERIGPLPAERLPDLVELVGAMHADAELSARLPGAGATLRASFLDYFISICQSDLDEMTAAGSIPPFVAEATVGWMVEEVEELRRVADAAAFDGPAVGVVHGDLWYANVLLEPDALHIVDWDDIHHGDPARDLGLLLMGHDEVEPWLGAHADDTAFRERFALTRRATILLNVVDPLSDWAEADIAPAHAETMRSNAESVHRWALDLYRERYG